MFRPRPGFDLSLHIDTEYTTDNMRVPYRIEIGFSGAWPVCHFIATMAENHDTIRLYRLHHQDTMANK